MIARRLLAPLVVLATLLLAAIAPAGSKPTAHLVYDRKAGATICPEEIAVKQSVAVRLGYDPFADGDAQKTIWVEIAKVGGELRATNEVRGEDGKVEGTRKLVAPANDCAELASSITLAISIAIDPLGGITPAASSTSSSSASTPAPSTTKDHPIFVPPSARPSADVTPPRDLELVASLGVVSAIGAGPGLTFGATASGAVRWPSFSIGIEGRADLPSSREAIDGEVRASLLLATLLPCLHRDILLVCPALSLGVLRGAGFIYAKSGFQETRQPTTFYAATGVRLGVQAPIGDMFAFRIYGDALGTLTRTILRIEGQDVWTTPTLQGSLGISLLGRF